jgi:hypothetical protein
MWGCEPGTAFPARRPTDAAQLVKQVSLGHTTAADAEALFGAADDHEPDGSLVYRFARTRGRDERKSTEAETVKLRFEHGVLSKICRTRS